MVIRGLLLLKMPLGGCLIHSSLLIIKMLWFCEDVLGKQVMAMFQLSYMTLQDQGGCMPIYFESLQVHAILCLTVLVLSLMYFLLCVG